MGQAIKLKSFQFFVYDVDFMRIFFLCVICYKILYMKAADISVLPNRRPERAFFFVNNENEMINQIYGCRRFFGFTQSSPRKGFFFGLFTIKNKTINQFFVRKIKV